MHSSPIGKGQAASPFKAKQLGATATGASGSRHQQQQGTRNSLAG